MFEIDDYIRRFARYPAPDAAKHWVREHEEVSVHTRALTPDKLIDQRRPFEDEGIKEYRIKNYEPITASMFSRAIDNLQRIMSGAQATVNVDNDLRDYLNEPNFDNLDFRTYINKKVVRRMIEDPNGVLCWWPVGEGVLKSNTKVDVKPRLVLSTQIKHYDDNVFTFLSRERSPVQVEIEGSSVTVNEGKVYFIVTEESYFKYSQFGKKSDNKMELEEIYKHGLGRLPLITLGGEEAEELKRDGSSVIYLKSYFYSAVPYANEAIRQFSDHQGIMVTAAFPIREIEETPCTNRNCKNGVVTVVEGEGAQREGVDKACHVCGGTGSLIPMSPYGVLHKRRGSSLLKDGEGRIEAPMMRYISPDVGIVEYSGKHWRDLLKDAEKALNLLFIGEAQSGVAKEIDREDKVSMLDKIGANIYHSIILQSLRIIERLRNVREATSVSITLPATFQAKGEHELIEEISTLRDKEAPSFLLGQATIDYVKKRYSGNDVMMRAVDVLAIYDPIFYLTQSEKDALLAATVITEEQHARSLYAFTAIKAVANEMEKKFVTAEYPAIEQRVSAYIAPLVQRRTPPENNLGS